MERREGEKGRGRAREGESKGEEKERAGKRGRWSREKK